MKILHDLEKRQFRVEDGSYHAVLLYAQGESRMDFYHIYVPDPLRGRSLAGKILMEAFKYARDKGYRVTATCPFIAGDFLKRFPEYQALVDPGEFVFVKKQKSGK